MANDKVTGVLINRLLKVIEKEGKLPWQKPWYFRYAMNYFTEHTYTGINRWLLPAGEYMSAEQLNMYNKKMGTNYRFAKGIEWIPTLMIRNIKSHPQASELTKEERQFLTENKREKIRRDNNTYAWSNEDGCVMKSYMLRRFWLVAEIAHFVDGEGNNPPSKIEGGKIEFVIENPDRVVKEYVQRENIGFYTDAVNEAYYDILRDSVHIPKRKDFKSAEALYATIFHELGHSTGASNRLARKEVYERTYNTKKYEVSREELVAEMCACLLCAETGIYNIEYSEMPHRVQQNSEAYIKTWYDRIKSGVDDIVYIASDAEKACKFVLGEYINATEESEEKL